MIDRKQSAGRTSVSSPQVSAEMQADEIAPPAEQGLVDTDKWITPRQG